MKRLLLITAALLVVCPTLFAQAGEPKDAATMVRSCITAAAEVYRLPPSMIVILLRVEGGSLGRVSQNTNDTVDIGPMQVNQIWIPAIASHWRATPDDTYRALRDSFCANVEAGSWILRKGLDEARGNFWEGVGTYHSHDPEHKARYLRLVLDQVLRLQAQAEHLWAIAPHPLPVARPLPATPASAR